ncbi:MAG: hypothetical protein H7X93_12190 [Sphingomonadaceae bacterium]|nr:hypothetical protein [Sphingomonadaceae bacterium]
MSGARETWPVLDWREWRETAQHLHLMTQIVGKVRLGLAPWQNHGWQVALYVTARGLTTSPMPAGDCDLQIDFDFIDDRLVLARSDGARHSILLAPGSIADFHAAVLKALGELGVEVGINPMPSEIADAVPFTQDTRQRAYDADAARRCWRMLAIADQALARFRTRFLGKASPVHFFWGSFDLAMTRFSGRAAPPHPGGVPNLPDAVTREAYSHEVMSAGFWPGSDTYPRAAFYAYAYPTPQGFADARIAPDAAGWNAELGEFVLDYDAAREADDPEEALQAFFQSAYDAAADLGDWDRAALDCPPGVPGRPRLV